MKFKVHTSLKMQLEKK